METKKGVSLSLNFIIIAALAVIALIVIALFFLGGSEKLFKKQTAVSKMSEQTVALARQACSFSCSVHNKEVYNNPTFPDELKQNGINNCEQLFSHLGMADVSYEDRCGQCSKSDSAKFGVICSGKTRSECASSDGCEWKTS